jgi:hypothetical protein
LIFVLFGCKDPEAGEQMDETQKSQCEKEESLYLVANIKHGSEEFYYEDAAFYQF